jgi:hypothetical protein
VKYQLCRFTAEDERRAQETVLCIVRKKKEREGELVGSAKYLLIVKRSDNAMLNVI